MPFDSFQTTFDFVPTEALTPFAASSPRCVPSASEVCGQRTSKALSTRLQRDTYMSSKGATLTLYHLSAQGSQALKTPVPQGVSHLLCAQHKTVGPLCVQIFDFKQGDRPLFLLS